MGQPPLISTRFNLVTSEPVGKPYFDEYFGDHPQYNATTLCFGWYPQFVAIATKLG